MNFAAIKKLKKLQEEMIETQRQIDESIFTASSGGVVSVDVKGNKEIVNITVLEGFEIESRDDYEMLSDMIVSACSQAYKEIEKTTKEKMSKYESLLGSMNGMF